MRLDLRKATFDAQLSLSTLVLNSRDRCEYLWLPPKMGLENDLTATFSFTILP